MKIFIIIAVLVFATLAILYFKKKKNIQDEDYPLNEEHGKGKKKGHDK